jgi:predicted nucleic acid-binding protein
MSKVLVDSSIWIAYFKTGKYAKALEELMDANHICVNDVILAELCPSILHKKERALNKLLLSIHNAPLNIDWRRIISMQTLNLRNGLNKVGIPDLVIAQNTADNRLMLFSEDKHFQAMSSLHGFNLYEPTRF